MSNAIRRDKSTHLLDGVPMLQSLWAGVVIIVSLINVARFNWAGDIYRSLTHPTSAFGVDDIPRERLLLLGILVGLSELLVVLGVIIGLKSGDPWPSSRWVWVGLFSVTFVALLYVRHLKDDDNPEEFH